MLALAAVALWVASREVRYLTRAAVEEALILARRHPIGRIVADPSTDDFTRGRLQLVLAARDFAAESLHLAARRTYTTYSRVRRDTLVLVLSASPSDRLAAYTWSYPIVGRVPYKGFFDLRGAQAEAERLQRLGLDTYLRVSDAFSTLGWFDDPLLSTIVRVDSVDLAATVIHEILHNTIWVRGNVPFNESLADFVGYRGAERFFRSRGDVRSAAFAAARWLDEIRLAHFYDSLAAKLERLYAGGLRGAAAARHDGAHAGGATNADVAGTASAGAVAARQDGAHAGGATNADVAGTASAGAALEAERQRLFGEARDDLAGPVGKTLQTIDGRRLARRPLNNAVVVAARLYRSDLDKFEALLAADGGDVVRAIADLKRRVAGGGDPWAGLPSRGDGP